MTAVPPEAVTAEAWAAAGQAARGYAPDLAEALAVHIAAGPDGRHIAEIVGAAVAKAARDAVEAAAPHIRAQVYAEIRQLMNDNDAHYDCDPHYGVPAADLIGDGDD